VNEGRLRKYISFGGGGAGRRNIQRSENRLPGNATICRMNQQVTKSLEKKKDHCCLSKNGKG